MRENIIRAPHHASGPRGFLRTHFMRVIAGACTLVAFVAAGASVFTGGFLYYSTGKVHSLEEQLHRAEAQIRQDVETEHDLKDRVSSAEKKVEERAKKQAEASAARSEPFPGVYAIFSAAGGKCLDAHSPDTNQNGCKVHSWHYCNTANQRWKLHRIKDDEFTIECAAQPGKVLDLDKSQADANGARTELYDDNGELSQRWHVILESGGRYIMKNCASGRVLDKDISDSAEDTRKVQVCDDLGNDNQRWVLFQCNGLSESVTVKSVIVNSQESVATVTTESVDIPPGVKASLKRSKTFEYKVEVTWQSAGETSLETSLKGQLVVAEAQVKNTVLGRLQRESKQYSKISETKEQTVDVDGDKTPRVNIKWVEKIREGTVVIAVDGKDYTFPIKVYVGGDLKVEVVK